MPDRLLSFARVQRVYLSSSWWRWAEGGLLEVETGARRGPRRRGWSEFDVADQAVRQR